MAHYVTSSSSRLQTRNGSRYTHQNLSRGLITQSSSASSAPGYISGEKMSNGKVRTLSALYRPTFEKLPTFPSIYQTKYQKDFKYIPFPLSSNFKPIGSNSKYIGFKFGTSSYCKEFHNDQNELKIEQWKRKPIPSSRHRHNNPQSSLKVVQNHPEQIRWSWSKLECTKPTGVDLRQHRWNSR